MEKSFRRLKVKSARRAYVEAELVTGLAHQIRVIRQQRNWTQGHLAKRLKTTQGAVSRMEDPSYGKFSIRSLLQVADVFDVALQTRFLPFSEFMFQTWDTTPQRLEVLPYSKDAERVCFFAETPRNTYVKAIEYESTPASSSYRSIVNVIDQSRDLLPKFTISPLREPATASAFMKLGDHQLGFERRTQLAKESE
jgi:transcriptional regulator with XRE-family HTH domain